jgi:6-phosphogluconolactonase (cycloisomerase 2 family)
VWWTMQYAQASGHLSLDFSGAVKTGETDDVGASHICVDHQGNFIFTANYGEDTPGR